MFEETTDKYAITNWVRIIESVQARLGLFVFVVLVVETILGTLAGISDSSNQRLIIVGILLLILALVGIARLQLAQSLIAQKNDLEDMPGFLSEAKAMFISIGMVRGDSTGG